jgi:hypothetical protein
MHLATVKSYLKMMNGVNSLFPSALRLINETDAICARLAPSINEVYRVSSLISAALNPSWMEAIWQVQEAVCRMNPAIQGLQNSVAKLFNPMTPSICDAVETVARIQIELQPLLRELNDVYPTATQFTELVQRISQYAYDIDFIGDVAEIDGLTEEEKESAIETAREILSKPENWEQKLVKSLATMQKKHPVVAKAIVLILSIVVSLVLGISSNYIYDTIKPAKLRVQPSQDAPVITMVNASQVVFIINDTRYYYEVKYTDPITGEIYSGWVSKRSIRKYEEEK